MDQKERTDKPLRDWDITVTGRHVLVTDAMKDYAIEKLSKVERFNTRIIDVHVTMDIQKLDHVVDIVMKVNDFRLKSHATTTDMYASIDAAVDKIQAQIRRYKNKLQDHHARGVAAVDMKVNVFKKPDQLTLVNEAIDEENARAVEAQFKPHDIVKQETRSLKILTYDEAVMKMELSLDYSFLVFRSEEDQKVKVIYRRKDENYGIIEPE